MLPKMASPQFLAVPWESFPCPHSLPECVRGELAELERALLGPVITAPWAPRGRRLTLREAVPGLWEVEAALGLASLSLIWVSPRFHNVSHSTALVLVIFIHNMIAVRDV